MLAKRVQSHASIAAAAEPDSSEPDHKSIPPSRRTPLRGRRVQLSSSGSSPPSLSFAARSCWNFSLLRASLHDVRAPVSSDEVARHSSVIPMKMECQDAIIDCPVCLYWSERLETIRTCALSHSEAVGEEKRLLATIKQHQVEGACVRRLPYLLELLAEPTSPEQIEIGGYLDPKRFARGKEG